MSEHEVLDFYGIDSFGTEDFIRIYFKSEENGHLLILLKKDDVEKLANALLKERI